MNNELAESPLSEIETGRLAACEAMVERGLETFVHVGIALFEIRDSRLYRERFPSFEGYCRDRWGMSRIHAHRMIVAAQVAADIFDRGLPPPTSESQIRPLTRLEPEQRSKAWATAVDAAPKGRVTGAHVQQTIRRLYSEQSPEAQPAATPIPDFARLTRARVSWARDRFLSGSHTIEDQALIVAILNGWIAERSDSQE